MNKEVVLSNFVWRFAERCGAQLIAFIVSIVLARILSPEAYGTVALISVFTTILQVFVDSGFGNALIQKRDSDDVDFSTVFYANIIFCIILYLTVYFISPQIATFYGNPELVSYIRVLSFTVLISGVKNVQQAYVSKHMLFKKFFYSTLIGTIIAGIIGVIMALYSFGVWALIAQQVINLLIDTIILWITVKWRPIKTFSFVRLKVLFAYGWKLLASSIIDVIYNNTRQLIIGKLFSSIDLAYYNRGRQFPNVIIQNINNSIDSVLLPTMALEQDDKERVRAMTSRAIRVSTYIMAPLMMGLIAIGEPFIGLILTDKWLPCVPFMDIFCISFMFYPIHTANLNAIKALGYSDMFLKLEILKKLIGFITLLFTIKLGVMAIAYSLLFTSVTSQIINSWPNKKLLNYGYIEQIKDILPAILLAIMMGMLIYPVNLLNISNILKLFIQIPLGIVIYIFGSMIFQIDSFKYLKGILRQYFMK